MHMTRKEIDEAVKDPAWQAFRASLKGLPTEEKLDRLQEYTEACTARRCREQICIDNYINALLRGGQLKHSGGTTLTVVK